MLKGAIRRGQDKRTSLLVFLYGFVFLLITIKATMLSLASSSVLSRLIVVYRHVVGSGRELGVPNGREEEEIYMRQHDSTAVDREQTAGEQRKHRACDVTFSCVMTPLVLHIATLVFLLKSIKLNISYSSLNCCAHFFLLPAHKFSNWKRYRQAHAS